MSGPEIRGVRFLQDNALALALLAVAGFSLLYVTADELDDPVLRREFFQHIRELLNDVSRERAFLVLTALNELHPDPARRAMLDGLVKEMRRYP